VKERASRRNDFTETTTTVRIPTHAPRRMPGRSCSRSSSSRTDLQLAWDLYHAEHAPEVKEIRKRIKRVPVNARFDKIRASA
jgi:hypothetical protein